MMSGSVVCFSEERMNFLRMCQSEAESTDPQSSIGKQCANRYNEMFRGALDAAGDLPALRQLTTLRAPNAKAAECLQRKIDRAETIADRRDRESRHSVDRRGRRGNWNEPPDLVEA